MAESFWSTLKTEFYDRKRWATRDAARKAVAYWIEVVYNRRRRHSALGMVSPVDFENHTGSTISRKETAAEPLGSSTTCPRFAGNPMQASGLNLRIERTTDLANTLTRKHSPL